MKLVFKGVNANKNGRIIQENRPDDQDAHCHHCVNLKSYNFWFIKMCHVFLSQLKELFAESKNEFCCLVAHLAIQHPGCREHQRNVACHIDHGCPVNGSAANLVIPHHDICDNWVLEPVHGVRCRTQYEYRQHQPAAAVLPALERRHSVLLKHHATCQHTGCWYNCYSRLIAFEVRLLLYDYRCRINVPVKVRWYFSYNRTKSYGLKQWNYTDKIHDIHITIIFRWASPISWIPTKMNCYSSHDYKQHSPVSNDCSSHIVSNNCSSNIVSNDCSSNIVNCPILLPKKSGPGSAVGIATGYWLDGPGIEPRWGWDFLHLSTPVLGPTQPPVQWVPVLSRGQRAAGAWRWPLTPF